MNYGDFVGIVMLSLVNRMLCSDLVILIQNASLDGIGVAAGMGVAPFWNHLSATSCGALIREMFWHSCQRAVPHNKCYCKKILAPLSKDIWYMQHR